MSNTTPANTSPTTIKDSFKQLLDHNNGLIGSSFTHYHLNHFTFPQILVK